MTVWVQRVMNLSEAQAQDLMFLRRLNLTKRCVLSTERKVLMHQMAISEAEVLNDRSDNLTTVSLLAAQMQHNTAEDRQVYYKLARALYRGVSSLSQFEWWCRSESVDVAWHTSCSRTHLKIGFTALEAHQAVLSHGKLHFRFVPLSSFYTNLRVWSIVYLLLTVRTLKIPDSCMPLSQETQNDMKCLHEAMHLADPGSVNQPVVGSHGACVPSHCSRGNLVRHPGRKQRGAHQRRHCGSCLPEPYGGRMG